MTRLLALAALTAALLVPAADAAVARGTITVADLGAPHAKPIARRAAPAALCGTTRPGGQMASEDGVTIHHCR